MAGRIGAVLLAATLLAGCGGPGLPQGWYATQDHRWQLLLERENGRRQLVLFLPNGEEYTFLVEGDHLFPTRGQ